MSDGQCRLVDSGFVTPAVSAALDEAIIEAHSRGEVTDTLHFYVRSSPTVSVGHFQKVRETLDLDECRSRGVSIVRRRSGGSSIYTDKGQLIYAMVLSNSDLPATPEASFEMLCGILAKALSSLGMEAKYRPVNDIEVGGRKVSGSAQLRRRGSILQHGTIIIDTDLETMDSVLKVDRSKNQGFSSPSDRITTLAHVLGTAPDMTVVKARICAEFSRHFDISLAQSALTSPEACMAEEFVERFYSKDEWNLKY